MRAIILAAGEGTRLRPYTLDRPKCMVELAGKPLLTHQIDVLRSKGVEDITIVTGYRADAIRALGLPTRHNEEFDRTNMVASMMCARDLLDGSDDVLITYSDIVYGPEIAAAILSCTAPFATSINLEWQPLWEVRMEDPLADVETLKMNGEGDIVELGREPASLDEVQGQYMGLIRASADFAPRMVAFHDALDPQGTYEGRDLPNMFMTALLQGLIDAGHPLRAIPERGGWLEVDTKEDLETYSAMFDAGTLARFWRPGTGSAP